MNGKSSDRPCLPDILWSLLSFVTALVVIAEALSYWTSGTQAGTWGVVSAVVAGAVFTYFYYERAYAKADLEVQAKTG
jgi:hypothetical protein